jgi:tungstate transport system ATP-binding protein
MLDVEGLRLERGGRQILDLPAFAVRTGEVLAVVGPNGAGKSSLLQSLALLVPATFQRYSLDGRPVRLPAETLAIRRQMALVMQEALLLDTTVLENAASGLLLRGVPRQEAGRIAADWLERLGVGHLVARSARQLSGGEAQRVSLARALALAPRLLLLDEPFSALDVLTRTALLQELRPLLKQREMTALLVTHDVTEVAHLADRMAVLEEGRLVQEGTPQAVLAAPVSAIVKRMAGIAADMAAALTSLTQAQPPKGAPL